MAADSAPMLPASCCGKMMPAIVTGGYWVGQFFCEECGKRLNLINEWFGGKDAEGTQG